jgi:nucleoside phosphorylase
VIPIATTGRVGGGTACEVEAMEGFGVLRAASLAGIPAVEVRAVSNAVAERDRTRWRTEDALGTLAAAVPQLLDALEIFDA